MSRRLRRWHTETFVYFPEGIGVVPFQVPGSEQQMKDTAAVLQWYRLAVWPRHGVIARSDEGVQKAGDLVEYAETAAHYEYLNLQAGEPSGGLSEQDLKFLSAQLGVSQTIF
jgi:rhamnulose-1-phosphate aldolase